LVEIFLENVIEFVFAIFLLIESHVDCVFFLSFFNFIGGIEVKINFLRLQTEGPG
jgi:hypothetical protein